MVRCLLRSDVFWVSPLDAEREAPGRGAVDLQVLNFGTREEVLDRVFRLPVVHVRLTQKLPPASIRLDGARTSPKLLRKT